MKIVSLDIGGTAIKYGIFFDGKISNINETDTNAKLGGENLFNTVCKIINTFDDFDYIAISTAGQVNPLEGYIIYANENIPNYTGVQLKKRLEEIYKVPVFVENDVNAMALGEGYFGAGKDEKDFLCLTYGTGIGGAIVVNREIYYGNSFSAGEFGSIITHGDVRKEKWGYFDGSYEKYASVTALVQKAAELNSSYKNGRILFESIEKDGVKPLINDWIDEVLLGLVTLIHLFNPSCIILGGGIMAQPYVIERIQGQIYDRIMPNYRNVNIKNAQLSNEAGMYGAVTKVIG